jgi:hypothetical protein
MTMRAHTKMILATLTILTEGRRMAERSVSLQGTPQAKGLGFIG